MSEFRKEKPENFASPTQLPRTSDEAEAWQKNNSTWWEENPMRYDWHDSIPYGEFTSDFYKEIDRRFFLNARDYLNPKFRVPFGEFIDFEHLGTKDVLEIGVGNGSHAQLLASHARSFTGIDLTDYAVLSTKKRMEAFGLTADIRRMDAEKLGFSDGSFDFVWSWGVIHHSANTLNILKEIYRVLRPGGRAVIMVYYRGWWDYYLMGVLEGIASGNLFKTRSLAKSVQLHTDGALARYYSKQDWMKITKPLFAEVSVCVRGPKSDIILLPASKLKDIISSFLPLSLSRFLTGGLNMGGFLISYLDKK